MTQQANEPEVTDKYILDWIEERCDEITVIRPLDRSARYVISWCTKFSGCQEEATKDTIRGAVIEAMRLDDDDVTVPPEDDDDEDDDDDDA